MKKIDRFPANFPGSSKMLDEKPTIHPTCKVINSSLGKWTELMQYTTLVESTLDDYSYTAGHNSIIYSTIGKFVNIAAMVRINPGNHPMDRVCQHHMMYRRKQYGLSEFDDTSFFQWRKSQPCVVGHDVWIGHSAIILPGVTLGHGCVVGAGAVVTHDLEPYSINVGVPARRIRFRFREDIIESLLSISWWDWDDSYLRERMNDLVDPERFIEKYKN